MIDQRHLRHVLSGDLDSTGSAIAILHTLRAADLAHLLATRGRIRPDLKCCAKSSSPVATVPALYLGVDVHFRGISVAD